MFDPTVFDNLKVAFENRVYDLETIEQKIRITNRQDQMDFAVMSRQFGISFTLAENPELTGEISLSTTLNDLASEIMELEGETPGCALKLRFIRQLPIEKGKGVPYHQAQQLLHDIWEHDIDVKQTISYVVGSEASGAAYIVEAAFKTRINEDHMQDISNFLYHMLRTMEMLGQL